MKLRTALLSASTLCFAVFAGSGSAHAQATNLGSIYIVHGAPGRDLALNNYPTYPIDVLVANQYCVVKNMGFGMVSEPLVGPAGTYDIKISFANAVMPCSGTPVLEAQVPITGNTATYAVAAVSPVSSPLTGALTAYTFTVPLNSVARGTAQVTVANASTVPAVDFGVAFGPSGSFDPGDRLTNIAPGKSQSQTTPAGGYSGIVYQAGTDTVLLGPVTGNLRHRSVDIVFLVGTSQSGSLQLITSKIQDVF